MAIIRCNDCGSALLCNKTDEGYLVLHDCKNGKAAREMWEAREKELKAPVCKCVCHEYPDHMKLQDALEALRFHQAETAKLQAQVYALESQIAEVCPEDTDIREHVRLLQSLIEGHRAKISQLQVDIAELRAGAAAVMEKAIALCQQYAEQYSDYRSGASYCAHKLAFLIPADSAAALAEVKLKARLEEAEWWHKMQSGEHQCVPVRNNILYLGCERLAQLRAEKEQRTGFKMSELLEAREKELKAPGLIEHMRMLQDRNKFLQAETAKLQAEIAELKAPMKCGHPYACWAPGVVVFDSIDVLNREKTKMPYCAWCAEIAELNRKVFKDYLK